MRITTRTILALVGIVFLFLILLLTLYFVRKSQDIRPRALGGVANLRLNADAISVNVGDQINVLMSVELTDANVRLSGIDAMLVYDGSMLKAVSVLPATNAGDAFTEAPIVQADEAFDSTNNFVRVALVANKPVSDLVGGTQPIASVTFEAIAPGSVEIKYPDDNNLLQVVGE